MKRVDLIIKGGKVVSAGHTSPQWVAVDKGKIVALGYGECMPEAEKIIDASGKYVLPGGVDYEHHAGQPIKESVLTNARGQMAGGVTTGGFMHNSGRTLDPPIEPGGSEEIPLFSDQIPRFMKETINGRCSFDYFFAPELNSPDMIRDIPKLSEKLGVSTFKFYLHTMAGEKMWDMWAAGRERGDRYFDDGDVFWAMREIARLGPPAHLILHCENWMIARLFRAELEAQGKTKAINYNDRSPAFCEAGEIRRWAYYAKVAKCPITINHVTTPDSVREVKLAKADGVNISGNVQPHYLLLNSEWGVINVPLRLDEYFDSLWEALRTGVIDTIAGDNVWAKHRKLEVVQRDGLKPRSWAWNEAFVNGTNGFVYPVMLSEGVNKDRITIERLVELYCENPAKKVGLFPRKGTISIGSDADFAIVDLKKKKELTRDMVFSNVGWSIYEGRELQGWPVMTILRGNVVMEWPEGEPNRKIVGEPIGQYIPPKPGYALYPTE